MPYPGQTYRVPCIGGWTANQNYDNVANESMIDPKNINHHKGGYEPRGGCLVKNPIAIAAQAIMGLYQYTLESGSVFLLAGLANGTIYTSDQADYTVIDTQLKAGLTASKYFHFETFYNKVYICNGADIPQMWNGSAAATAGFLLPAQYARPIATIGAAGNIDNGIHYYKYTHVIGGVEYNGSYVSAAFTVTDKAAAGQAALTSIAPGPTGTTARKVYRTTAGGSTYYLLATIADNTTTTATDNSSDATIIAAGAMSAVTIGRAPADWASTNQPIAMIRHGMRASKRLWAYGNANYPNRIYASDSGTDDFSDENVTTINILDTKITGMIEFGGKLIVFSQKKSYIINDEALDIAEWGYQSAVWEGGAAHQRVIVKTPTDVMVMSETGEMFSITASQQYGDYQVASVTRPAFLHKWIEDYVDLTKMAQFHGVYDQELRCIKMYMITTPKTAPDMAMVLFVDLGPGTGWTKHEFLVNQICSTEVRVSAYDWKIYTGGSAGFVYENESSTLRDAGEIYRVEWTTPPLTFENPRSTKRYDRMWIVAKAIAFETINTNIYIDERSITGGYYIADEYGVIFGDENNNSIVSEPFNPWVLTMTGASDILKNFKDDIGYPGTRIQANVYNILGENFFISQLMFDLTECGNN